MNSFDCRYNSTVAISVSDDEGYTGHVESDVEVFPEFIQHQELLPSVSHSGTFAMVRQILIDLGLDRERFGTHAWNPLGSLVKEHAQILLKPNWVMHDSRFGTDCLTTHPSLIYALLPYVFLARPSRVIVGDAPLQYCDFEALQLRYDFSKNNFPGLDDILEVKDFRRTISTVSEGYWRVAEGCKPHDDYREIELGRLSLLEPIAGDWRKFRVTVYDPRLMWRHHQPGHHAYLIAKDILEADLVVNLPKLKTHQKAGITCCLKNLIGINGNKEYLPHHRKGGSRSGGDAYRGSSFLLGWMEQIWDLANKNRNRHVLFNALVKLAFKVRRLHELTGGDGRAEGSWPGNDTIWRTCLDLNRILLYATSGGSLSSSPTRNVLHIVDAIVAGQGDGPLNPEPLQANFILGGFSAVAVDWVAACMMGFVPDKIPTICNAFKEFDLPLVCFKPEDIELVQNGMMQEIQRVVSAWGVQATPAPGWAGSIESRVHGNTATCNHRS